MLEFWVSVIPCCLVPLLFTVTFFNQPSDLEFTDFISLLSNYFFPFFLVSTCVCECVHAAYMWYVCLYLCRCVDMKAYSCMEARGGH